MKLGVDEGDARRDRRGRRGRRAGRHHGELPAQDRDPEGQHRRRLLRLRPTMLDAIITWSLRHRLRRGPGVARRRRRRRARVRAPADRRLPRHDAGAGAGQHRRARARRRWRSSARSPRRVEQAHLGPAGPRRGALDLASFGLSQVTVDLRGRHRHLPRAPGRRRAAGRACELPAGHRAARARPGRDRARRGLPLPRHRRGQEPGRAAHRSRTGSSSRSSRSVPRRRRGQRVGRRRAADPGRRRPARRCSSAGSTLAELAEALEQQQRRTSAAARSTAPARRASCRASAR